MQKVETLKKDGSWVLTEEGVRLASSLNLPIRVITPFEKGEFNEDLNELPLIDYLYSPQKGEDATDWNLVENKPEQYITIVDLGRHFVFAQPTKEAPVLAAAPTVRTTIL